MINLAKTYKNLFPTIFDSTYSVQNFTFGYSRRIRTQESCKAFAVGLFGRKGSEKIQTTYPNSMLRVIYLIKRKQK